MSLEGSKMLKITGIWENKDKNGNVYYSGYLGSSRVMIMKNTYKKEGTKEPDFNMYLAEAKKKEDATGVTVGNQKDAFSAADDEDIWLWSGKPGCYR